MHLPAACFCVLLSLEAVDPPPLADCARLPAYAASMDVWRLGNRLCAWVRLRREFGLDSRSGLAVVLAQAEYATWAWGHAADACNPDYPACLRRDHLKALKALVGDEAYYRGRLPPLPLWCIPEAH